MHTPEGLIEKARGGDGEALGRVLESYRNYLRLLAATQVGKGLLLRVDPSDLVQNTFLEAHRGFPDFRGKTEAELVAWLRRILVHNLADEAKRHGAERRDFHREESLEVLLDRSSLSAHEALAAGISSPSMQAIRRERAVIVADTLARLPDEHREVVVLRNLLHLKFDEIAVRMGRTPSHVRVLWTRALVKLRSLLEERP